MENVFVDHNLQKKSALRSPGDRPFQEMPLPVIMVGAMHGLAKNPGYATAKET